MFLYFNSYNLQATQAETTLTVLGVAAGDVPEEAFAEWLRAHTAVRTS